MSRPGRGLHLFIKIKIKYGMPWIDSHVTSCFPNSGAVGELLAPVSDASDLPGAGFTVGVLGASESGHDDDDVIVPVTQ